MTSEIDFYLQVMPFEKIDLPSPFRLPPLSLEGITLLYIHGCGFGEWLELIQPWLAHHSERAVVVLEENLAYLDALLRLHPEVRKHPQIHLRFLPAKKLGGALEEVVCEFAHAEILVWAPYPYVSREKAKQVRLLLQRKSAVWNSALKETAYAHLLYPNLVRNFRHLPRSFFANNLRGKFEGVPAIICGAGPSLASCREGLLACEGKALIFAGGSSLSALSALGIKPDIGVAIDPNPKELEAVGGCKDRDVPLLYCSRLYPEALELFQGEIGYLRSHTGGALEAFMEERLGLEGEFIGPDLGREALSVTALTASICVALGCNPIVFVGVDLSYTGMRSYAPGIEEGTLTVEGLKRERLARDQFLWKKGKNGRRVATLVKWVMEAETLSKYAKERAGTQFFDATAEGLSLAGIPRLNLEELKLPPREGLKKRLEQEISSASLRVKEEEVEALLSELHSSLSRCEEFVQGILQEEEGSGKRALYECELFEEVAYTALFPRMIQAFTLLSKKSFQDEALFEKAKWEHLLSAIQQCKELVCCEAFAR